MRPGGIHEGARAVEREPALDQGCTHVDVRDAPEQVVGQPDLPVVGEVTRVH
jgi:hypothetical protein